MTLGDIKDQVVRLIEEMHVAVVGETTPPITDDPDILNKLNIAVNTIQLELAQIKKLSAKQVYTYTDSYTFDLPIDFYQVNKCNVPYEIVGKDITFDTEDTTINFYYFKYPTIITTLTDDDDELEVSLDCLNAMPYGVIADVMKGDPSDIYKDYKERYAELKSQLRLSDSSPMMTIDTTNAINDTLTSEF